MYYVVLSGTDWRKEHQPVTRGTGREETYTAGPKNLRGAVGLVLTRRPDRFSKIIASRTPVPTRQKQEKTSPRRSPPSIDFGLRESSSHEVSTNFFSLHLLGIHVGRGCAEKEFGKSHPEGHHREFHYMHPKQTKIKTLVPLSDQKHEAMRQTLMLRKLRSRLFVHGLLYTSLAQWNG